VAGQHHGCRGAQREYMAMARSSHQSQVKLRSNCSQIVTRGTPPLDGVASRRVVVEDSLCHGTLDPSGSIWPRTGLWRAEPPVPLRPKTLALLAYLVAHVVPEAAQQLLNPSLHTMMDAVHRRRHRKPGAGRRDYGRIERITALLVPPPNARPPALLAGGRLLRIPLHTPPARRKAPRGKARPGHAAEDGLG
jgi:hypothetical protein